MKYILTLILMLTMGNVLAADLPLLVKFSGTGFVPRNWARTEKCEIFANHVVVTKTYGEAVVSYELPFSSDEALVDMIQLASQEQIEEVDNGLCDGPATYIKANIFAEEHAEMTDLVLYATGGCGSPRKMRQGPYTNALIDLTATFCPTIH